MARPTTFEPGSTNPFAEGSESETLPETACVRREGTVPDSPGWSVRIVGNKYPLTIVGPRGKLYGAHEVLIESTDPVRDLADQPARQIERILWLARRRMRELERQEGVAWVGMFRNAGAAAGASIAHPHMQILALPFVPETAPVRACARPASRVSRDVLLERTKYHVVTAAPAPQVPYEMLIRPVRPLEAFTRETDPGLVDLAGVLRRWLRAMRRLLGNPAYNLVFASGPHDCGDLRWTLRILPRLGQFGGFEFATGMWVSSIPAAEAAVALRRAVRR